MEDTRVLLPLPSATWYLCLVGPLWFWASQGFSQPGLPIAFQEEAGDSTLRPGLAVLPPCLLAQPATLGSHLLSSGS